MVDAHALALLAGPVPALQGIYHLSLMTGMLLMLTVHMITLEIWSYFFICVLLRIRNFIRVFRYITDILDNCFMKIDNTVLILFDCYINSNFC